MRGSYLPGAPKILLHGVRYYKIKSAHAVHGAVVLMLALRRLVLHYRYPSKCKSGAHNFSVRTCSMPIRNTSENDLHVVCNI